MKENTASCYYKVDDDENKTFKTNTLKIEITTSLHYVLIFSLKLISRPFPSIYIFFILFSSIEGPSYRYMSHGKFTLYEFT